MAGWTTQRQKGPIQYAWSLSAALFIGSRHFLDKYSCWFKLLVPTFIHQLLTYNITWKQWQGNSHYGRSQSFWWVTKWAFGSNWGKGYGVIGVWDDDMVYCMVYYVNVPSHPLLIHQATHFSLLYFFLFLNFFSLPQNICQFNILHHYHNFKNKWIFKYCPIMFEA